MAVATRRKKKVVAGFALLFVLPMLASLWQILVFLECSLGMFASSMTRN